MNDKSISIALFEPEIAQNVGTILRTADCFAINVHIVEPCGFIWGNAHMKRSGMDYIKTASVIKHNNLEQFIKYCKNNKLRLLLSSTKGTIDYHNFIFKHNDVIIFGKESAGLPKEVMDNYYKLTIKMKENKRSLNLAVSCGIIMAHVSRY